jgi:thioredoxin-related protein
MKKLLILTIFLGKLALFSQSEKSKLRILTFKEVEKLQQQAPKPILIFIYTDWCKICFGMKKTTFKNTAVIRLLNEKFYLIYLNGEEKKDISFLGKTFEYKPSGKNTGTHQLVKELATIKGKINYPTTIILNAKFEIDLQINSFRNSKKMMSILKRQFSTNN